MTPPDSKPSPPSDDVELVLPGDLTRVLSAAPDGVVVTDARSGRVIFANPSFATLCERPVPDLLTMRIWELHPVEMDRPRGAIFEEVISKGSAQSTTQPIIRPDGSLCSIDFRAWTATWGGRKLIISIVRDISQRISVQDESDLRASHSKELLSLVHELEQAEDVAAVMGAVHKRVVEFLGFNHSSLCRYPANDTHCTRLAIRSSDERLSSLKDGVSFEIKGDELMEEIAGGAETQIVPSARLDPRVDRPSAIHLELNTIVRVATGLSSGTRIVLECVTLGEEGTRIPTDIQLEFARGLISHAGATVERLELARYAARSDKAISGLLEAIGSYTGQDFFDVLVSNLAKSLGIRHVLLAEPTNDRHEQIRSISFLSDGALSDPITYQAKGSPCALVIRDGFHFTPDNVQSAFPTDLDLVALEARAFLGVSMEDSEGVILGHLALLHDEPFEDPVQLERVARLFAARGAAELKRSQARRELQRSLDSQNKVNEILKVSGLPLNLSDKLQKATEAILAGEDGHSNSGGILLFSADSDSFHCEAWHSPHGGEPDSGGHEAKACPHRQAIASLEAVHIPSGQCEDCEHYSGEQGVILPIHLGGRAIGTLMALGEAVGPDSGQADMLKSSAGALALLIDSHRAQDALKATEESLRQSQKLEALGGLAGGIAHDFNNLMTAVLGNAELLLTGNSVDEDAVERIREIQSAGKSATRLTSQLLAFTRRQVLERRVVDLGELVMESTDMLRRLVPEDIEVTVLQPESELKILADAGQVQQVVMNLVVNARDAMPNGGKLLINLDFLTRDQGTEFAVLTIRDTGFGMDADTTARIFEPFFTTKEAGKGTGLGLSVVYGIISQHGGWIEVDGGLGTGAEFRIYLPLISADEANPEKESSAIHDAIPIPRRSLVVEDEDAVRRVTCLMLEQNGHEVISAPGGVEALELFEESPALDVVLLDVVMPGMSGVEVFREIRKRRPTQPVLFVTGHDPTERLRDFEGSPGVGLLRKPYTRKDLAEKLSELLDQ